MGENNPKQARRGLISQGVGGVQIADVSVDVETGVVKMNRLVAVQDCGLIVNPKTAESQVFGACIMSICAALYEERIMDAVTGRMLNAGFDFYKLAGIGDIGEIVVHLDISPEHDKRGVIGLGEPPVDSRDRGHRQRRGERHRRAGADRPADAGQSPGSAGREERLMQAFEYASPTTVKEALGLLADRWGEADVLAGGTDLLSLMKEYVHTPRRVVNIKGIKELGGIGKTAGGLRIGATVTLEELLASPLVRQEYPSLTAGRARASPARRSATWARSAATSASGRAAGISGWATGCLPKDAAGRPWSRTETTATTPSSAAVRRTSSAPAASVRRSLRWARR